MKKVIYVNPTRMFSKLDTQIFGMIVKIFSNVIIVETKDDNAVNTIVSRNIAFNIENFDNDIIQSRLNKYKLSEFEEGVLKEALSNTALHSKVQDCVDKLYEGIDISISCLEKIKMEIRRL